MREQLLVDVRGLFRHAVDVHLHLVELVYPEHALGVLARRAGLAPEVRAEGRVPGGQIRFLKPLVGVDPGQRHLGGPGQVQVVLFEVVEVGLLGGQEAGSVHGGLADQDRWQHRQEPLGGQPVEDEPVERHLGQGHVPDPVGEPGSRQPGAPGHVDPAPGRAKFGGLAGLEAERRRLAPGADGFRVLLGHPVRGGGVRQVGDAVEQFLTLPLGLGLLRRGLDQFVPELPQLGDLLLAGLGSPGQALLSRAQRLRALGQLPPFLVGVEQGIEIGGGAAAGEGGPVAVRLSAGSP